MGEGQPGEEDQDGQVEDHRASAAAASAAAKTAQ